MGSPRQMVLTISEALIDLRRRYATLPEASKTARLRRRYDAAVEAMEDLEREAHYEDQFVKD